MVGRPEAAWHLELVGHPTDETPAAPTEEDLLVLYLGGPVDPDIVRLGIAGVDHLGVGDKRAES